MPRVRTVRKGGKRTVVRKNRHTVERNKTARKRITKSARVTDNPSWWERMSPEKQKRYLATHPNSKLKPGKGGAKSRVKVSSRNSKPTKISHKNSPTGPKLKFKTSRDTLLD